MDAAKKIEMALYCVEALARFPARRRAAPEKRVLLISYDRLGDLLLLLPFARVLEKHYREQGYELHLLCNSAFADFAGKLLPSCFIHGFELKSFFSQRQYRLELLRNLRKMAFSATINPRIYREFLIDDFIARSCAAPERIGVAPGKQAVNPRLDRLSRNWYTRLIEPPRDFTILRHFRRFTEAVTGSPVYGTEEPLLPSGMLAGRRIKEPYVVIVPGALDPWRRWPIRNFAETIAGSAAFEDKMIAVSGTAQERTLFEELRNALPEKFASRMIDLTGKTTLEELAALLYHADSVFGNDTGTIHLAAAATCNSLYVITGQGQWGRFLPYNKENVIIPATLPECITEPVNCAQCDWHCSRTQLGEEPAPCIAAITAEHAMRVLNKTL